MKQTKISKLLRQLVLCGLVGLLLAGAFSCKKDNTVKTYLVKVKLVYPEGFETKAGITVKMENKSTTTTFDEPTDAEGIAEFIVTAGKYEISASESRVVELVNYIFNGFLSDRMVPTVGEDETVFELSLVKSEIKQLVIKELYNGGCQKDDGSGAFSNDQYFILYNNSFEPATFENMCIGMCLPYNSQATNNDYVDGVLTFKTEAGEEDWIPAGQGIWSFTQPVTIAPGEQIVVALKNAVDNTIVKNDEGDLLYSKSINFNNAAYYCTYDPESGYNNTTSYPPPAPAISVSHYLKAHRYGLGNAWALSTSSPAFFIFTTPGNPQSFVDDVTKLNYHGAVNASNERRKVSVSWIIDAVEVHTWENTSNKKRFTAAVDAGYVELYNQQGFTLYRNVDKNATEAIPENEGKIVYGYSLGTAGVTVGEGDKAEVINGTTDPSGIDAEASIKNGARIIYKNTNNTSNDFHMRSRASLRD